MLPADAALDLPMPVAVCVIELVQVSTLTLTLGGQSDSQGVPDAQRSDGEGGVLHARVHSHTHVKRDLETHFMLTVVTSFSLHQWFE